MAKLQINSKFTKENNNTSLLHKENNFLTHKSPVVELPRDKIGVYSRLRMEQRMHVDDTIPVFGELLSKSLYYKEIDTKPIIRAINDLDAQVQSEIIFLR